MLSTDSTHENPEDYATGSCTGISTELPFVVTSNLRREISDCKTRDLHRLIQAIKRVKYIDIFLTKLFTQYHRNMLIQEDNNFLWKNNSLAILLRENHRLSVSANTALTSSLLYKPVLY